MSGPVSFSDLAAAAYCPRKLYYRHRYGTDSPPAGVAAIRRLAFEYPALLRAGDDALVERPIDLDPATYRRRLRAARDRHRDRWPALSHPADRNVILEGRECRGRVGKLVGAGPPVPVRVSAGTPPTRGVWKTDAVRAVAAARAISADNDEVVDRAYVEYPRVAAIREFPITPRRLGAFRRALENARSIDNPPPRVSDARCKNCEYRERCGVKTASMASRAGFG